MTSNSQDFQIIGVDASSQEDVVLTISALSEANARAKAELRGVVVTAIAAVEPSPQPREVTAPLELALFEEIESALADEIQSIAKSQHHGDRE